MSNLPFDPTQPMFARLDYRPGQPPSVPPFPREASDIEQVYTLFISELVNVIQATATQNPLRMFMFNQMASNNWKNEDFLDFVQNASIYFTRMLRSGDERRDNNSLTRVANTVASVRAAYNAEQYHGLRSYIDPSLVQDIQSAAVFWTSLVKQNRPPQRNASNGWQDSQQVVDVWGIQNQTNAGNTYANGDTWGTSNNPGGWRDSPRNSNRDTVRPPVKSRGSWVGRDVDLPIVNQNKRFEQEPVRMDNSNDWRNNTPVKQATPAWENQQVNQQPVQRANYDAPAPVAETIVAPVEMYSTQVVNESNGYSYEIISAVESEINQIRKPPVAPVAKAVPVAPTQPAKVEVTKSTETMDGSIEQLKNLKHWRTTTFIPSNRWFTTIAFNPSTHDLFYRIHENGDMQPVLFKRKTNMDYDQHIGALAFSPTMPIGVKRMDIEGHQEELIAELGDKESIVNQMETVKVDDVDEHDRTYLTADKENVWSYNQIHLSAIRKTKGKARIVRQGGNIIENVVTTKRLTPYVEFLKKRISENTSEQALVVIAKQLAATAKKIDDGIDVDVDSVGLNAINRRLTKRVNACIREEFGRTDGTIDSFVEDIESLLTYLEQVGSTIHRVFLSKQEDIYLDSLDVLSGVLASEESARLIESLDLPEDHLLNEDFFITHFVDCASFTSVDVYAKELGFDYSPAGHSVLIVESQSPVLYALALNVFEYNERCDNYFKRHYLRTVDDVTLVFARSISGGDNFMVGKV